MDLGGAQVRYEDSENVIKERIETPDQNVTSLFDKVYSEAIKEPLLVFYTVMLTSGVPNEAGLLSNISGGCG